MANWYGATRTNYVKVTDLEAVKKVFKPFAVGIYIDGGGSICLLSEDEYGGWPASVMAEDDDGFEIGEELEFDFGLIVPYLQAGEVLVVISSGAEKLRNITGDSIAYAWDGRVTRVDINDIYEKVRAEFGVDTTRAEY